MFGSPFSTCVFIFFPRIQSLLRKARTTCNAQRTDIRGPISQVRSLRETLSPRKAPASNEYPLHPEYQFGDVSMPPNPTEYLMPPIPMENERNPSILLPHGAGTRSLPGTQCASPPPPAPTNDAILLQHEYCGYPVPLPGYANASEGHLAMVCEKLQATRGASPPQPMSVSYRATPPPPNPTLDPYTAVCPVSEPSTQVDKQMEQHEAQRGAMVETKVGGHEVIHAANPHSGLTERPADMTLKLGLDFAVAGPEQSQQREAFTHTLAQDLANASGLAPAHFSIKQISPGSIVVDTEIRPDMAGSFDPEGVARHLQKQASDPQSPLRCGAITRFTESISLPFINPSPAKPPKSMPEKPPLPVPLQRQDNVGQVPAPPLLRGSMNDMQASHLRNSLSDMPMQKTGVGIVFKRNAVGGIEVIALRPGSSSERSGAIFVGNTIMSVGPVPVTGASRETVIDLILGTPGTRVTLGLLRDAGTMGAESGRASQISVTLVRADVPSAPPSLAGSAAPMAPLSVSSPPMMVLPDSMSHTITATKEAFQFVGALRTVAVQRSPGRPGETTPTGVGVSFQATKSGGHMMVTKVLSNGPADLSQQIRAGDIIMCVNNIAVQGKRIPEVVAIIKGPPGSVVVLALQGTSIDQDGVSQGGPSLYNSASSHVGTNALAMRYNSIPRAPPPHPLQHPLHSSVSSTHSWPNPVSAPPMSQRGSASPMLPPNMRGIRVVRIQRWSLNQPAIGLNGAGIGMGFERGPDGVHTVCGLFSGGSAAQCGQIFTGDRLLSVDGMPTQGCTVKEVSERIQGSAGTDVALTLETVLQQPLSTGQQHDSISHVKLGAVGYSLEQSAPPTRHNSDAIFSVGLVLSEPLPCKVIGADLLMDRNQCLQGQQGYENQEISEHDSVLAINGKILQKQSLQQLTEMLSGPLHSLVELTMHNTSSEGDEMFTARLLCNMPVTDFAHWSEYINSPLGEERATMGAHDPPDHLPVMASQEPAVTYDLLPALRLTVKVLEAEGISADQNGAPPLCVANLRLICPDVTSDSAPDSVQATDPGQSAKFDDVAKNYSVQVLVHLHSLLLSLRVSERATARVLSRRSCRAANFKVEAD